MTTAARRLLVSALVVAAGVACGAAALAQTAAPPPRDRILFNKVNKFGSVKVLSRTGVDALGLFIDGRLAQWSGDGTVRRASYPLILGERIDRVLILGMGMGAEVAAAVAHETKVVHAVAPNPALPGAAKLFVGANRNALSDRRVVTYIADPVVWTAAPTRQTYDVVIQGLAAQRVAGKGAELSLGHFNESAVFLHELP